MTSVTARGPTGSVLGEPWRVPLRIGGDTFVELVFRTLYNTDLRRFPTNIVAGLFGFAARPQLQIDAGERETPQVQFDFDKKES